MAVTDIIDRLEAENEKLTATHMERSGIGSTSRPSGSVRVPAHNLKTTDFPACASQCVFVEAMGVGECESACPWKFDNDGKPIAQNGKDHLSDESKANRR
jgi:hypothetical protein